MTVLLSYVCRTYVNLYVYVCIIDIFLGGDLQRMNNCSLLSLYFALGWCIVLPPALPLN